MRAEQPEGPERQGGKQNNPEGREKEKEIPVGKMQKRR